MRISFKQGIIKAQPGFLQLTPTKKVNLNVAPPSAVIVTVSHGQSNYLITERQPVLNAWNGPFNVGTDYWLYWDIDVVTGQRTFGHTTIPPVFGNTAPSPQVDKHWFDTSTFQMKVWNGARWVVKIRVFAAKLQSGTVFVSMSMTAPSFEGTQIGTAGLVSITAGAIAFDVFNKGLKKSNGEFLTTEDLITANVGPSQIKTASLLVSARAEEPIPAYSIVRFINHDVVTLANSFTINQSAYGLVEQDADADDPVNITMEGMIQNSAWDWSAYPVNTPLYVDSVGQLTTSFQGINFPVGIVINSNTILLRPSSLTLGSEDKIASQTEMGSVLLATPIEQISENIVAVTTGGNGTFTITGNWALDLNAYKQLVVSGNTNTTSNGLYKVRVAQNSGPNTVIFISGTIPAGTTVSGIATFNKLPRVITEDDTRLGSGSVPLATNIVHGKVRLDVIATNPTDPVVLTPNSAIDADFY